MQTRLVPTCRLQMTHSRRIFPLTFPFIDVLVPVPAGLFASATLASSDGEGSLDEDAAACVATLDGPGTWTMKSYIRYVRTRNECIQIPAQHLEVKITIVDENVRHKTREARTECGIYCRWPLTVLSADETPAQHPLGSPQAFQSIFWKSAKSRISNLHRTLA